MHLASGKSTSINEDPKAKVTWTYGDFGEAHPGIAQATGKTRCNVMIVGMGGIWKSPAVLSDDGKSLTCHGLTRSIEVLEWMSEDEHAAFIASGDPVDALPHPYKMQPENKGKLVWLSGAPGLGKSTTARMMGKSAGYVYYEADAFISHVNPYVSTDSADLKLALFSQKFLKGVPQERIDAVARFPIWKLLEGTECDMKQVGLFYKLLCKDIAREHARIGGDFAVAHVVPKRRFRDAIRAELGRDLIFVVLHMSKEDQKTRIRARQKAFTDKLERSYSSFEPAEENEPNTIGVVVTKDMTRDDVLNKVLKLIEAI